MKVVLGSTLLAMPFGLGLNGPAVAQPLQSACDANDDGFGSSQEAQLCTHREFDEIARGERPWVPLLRAYYGPLKERVDEKRRE